MENNKEEALNDIDDLTAAAEKLRQVNGLTEKNSPEEIPDDMEDFKKLLDLNLLKEATLKIQLKKHPNKKIDDLLERRLNLKSKDFTGPFAIRVVASILIIFLTSIVIWSGIWVIGIALELNYFYKIMSTIISIILVSAMAITIFQPLPIIDENRLLKHITEEMKKLKSLTKLNEQKTTNKDNN